MLQSRYYDVQALDKQGRYLHYTLPTRSRARDCKAVLKAFGYQQVGIYQLSVNGRRKIY